MRFLVRIAAIIQILGLAALVHGGQAQDLLPSSQHASPALVVLEKIRQQAFSCPEAIVSAFVTAPDREEPEAIRAMLRSFDIYADYLSPEEFRLALAVEQQFVYGVGMDIAQEPSGELRCWPYPGQAAWSAGVRDNDVLKAVDGYSVTAANLEEIGILVRGMDNGPVRLLVQREGREIDILCNRQIRQSLLVSANQESPLPVLRIWRFERELNAPFRQALEKALPLVTEATPLILDLRGNFGGDLQSALELAQLFLPKGDIVGSVKERERWEVHMIQADGQYRHLPLAVWIDEGTGSAAEFLAAGLKDNGRALVFGTNSYGKAQTQQSSRLSDGGALKLTTGILFGPSGQTWNKTGLAPHFFAEGTDALLRATLDVYAR